MHAQPVQGPGSGGGRMHAQPVQGSGVKPSNFIHSKIFNVASLAIISYQYLVGVTVGNLAGTLQKVLADPSGLLLERGLKFEDGHWK